ncbi:hypothetical protein EJ08DRAFT_654012 [Tothia fuscella]|uniref:Protein SQS1 n=1 Tax=Tothia fuscella TaxID=1048955 RepID=A0A9P4NFQ0_9PEZI|nr:hypothetical protein EJ08DRAFT_654012 [Tothia fuscella]
MSRTKKKAKKAGVAARRAAAVAHDPHARNPRTSTSNPPSTFFSLQEEALNTEYHKSEWTPNSRLRDQRVLFVSSGLATPVEKLDTEEEDAMDASSSIRTPVSASGKENSNPSLLQTKPQHSQQSSNVIQPPLKIARKLSAEAPVFRPTFTANQPNAHSFFFMDSTGTNPPVRPTSPLVIRSPAPAVSEPSSEDEVLFKGRNSTARQVIDDPDITVQSSNHVQALQQTAGSSTVMNTVSITTCVQETVVSSTSVNLGANAKPHWNDSETPWVHRSKPGYGWTVPRTKSTQASSRSSPFLLRPGEDPDEEFLKDYLENAREQGLLVGTESNTFKVRDLDVQLQGSLRSSVESETSSSEDENGDRVQKVHRSKAAEANDDSDEGSDDEDEEEEVEDDIDDESIEDDESILDDMDLIERKMANLTDENIARLLAKQEELGITADELLIYDDEDGGLEAAVAREARSYKKNKPKSARRMKDDFADATLMADVLEQDPYGGFDIMDFERPSLRVRKKKGKLAELPFELSDSDLEETMKQSWAKDRASKKARKEARGALRTEGLLGKCKKTGKPDLVQKYDEGLTIDDIKLEMENFLNSSSQTLSFPPMDKRRRKMIHEIAAIFNMNTKSKGGGSGRYPTLCKTNRTLLFDETAFVAKARKVNLGFFPRLDKSARKSAKSSGEKSGGRSRGGAGAGARYRDGDVVGGTAPIIGVENRGRMMLEKMGWSLGTALGNDGQGILEPISHVVKNSKAGLG